MYERTGFFRSVKYTRLTRSKSMIASMKVPGTHNRRYLFRLSLVWAHWANPTRQLQNVYLRNELIEMDWSGWNWSVDTWVLNCKFKNLQTSILSIWWVFQMLMYLCITLVSSSSFFLVRVHNSFSSYSKFYLCLFHSL